MTGGPLRRLQELAVGGVEAGRLYAGDEGGESGGLPVRVGIKGRALWRVARFADCRSSRVGVGALGACAYCEQL